MGINILFWTMWIGLVVLIGGWGGGVDINILLWVAGLELVILIWVVCGSIDYGYEDENGFHREQ